ncbi:MAG: hypothetical protein NTX86_06035 [Candidatus Dependentiae bacterium]|nr:hypothetical protein [Candidatus Dependentiae bacterium]
MIYKKNNRLAALMLLATTINTITAMNLLRQYDTLIRPDFRFDTTGHISVLAEHGFNAKGFGECGDFTNVLRLWNEDQDALKMLEGFDSASPIGLLATNLRADGANDDGVRGHFNVCGNLHYDTVAFAGRWHFLNTWFLTAYLPVNVMHLSDVTWVNQTQNVSAGDFSVKRKLTNDFFANVKRLGDGLELGSWKRTGVGDLIVLIEWMENFIQNKPLLKNAQVTWRLGTNFPTGLRQDEDKIFALPFGYDGALGVIFGFGLDLSLGDYFKVGGDVQLQHLFGNTRCRRIKTDVLQTELLLLQKTAVYKDFGLMQRFNLYCQFCNMKGFDIKFGYQFFKRGDDVLAVSSPNFSDNIANTAISLEDFTMHHAIIKANYDFSVLMDKGACVKPALSLYARLPFNGKRAALCPAFGGIFALDF